MLTAFVSQNTSPISVHRNEGSHASHMQKLQLVASLVLFTLPFMQLFTIDFGFPLKIYEVAIVLWTGFCIGTMQIVIFDRSIFIRGLLLFAYAGCALFIILKVSENTGIHADLARFDPFLDGILKCGYILLCICGFDLVANAALRAPERAANAWIYGATLAAILHLFLFILTGTGHSIPDFPGAASMPHGQQFVILQGVSFFRAGTFMEGNYAGPYFVLSFIIAVTSRRFIYALLFFVAAILTFSTTAILGLIAAFLYILWTDRKNIFLYATFGIIGFAILGGTAALNTILIEKLTDTSRESSLSNREKTFFEALGLFEQNPLMGVGIEQYGLHEAGYVEWGRRNGSNVKTGILKAICNNVYMELASEFGLIGMGFFLVFLIPVLRLTNKGPFPFLRAGSFVILLAWLASPTFTLMYYWAFWGLVCGISRRAETRSDASMEAIV